MTKAGIKFTSAVGSVFCWIDLRSALSQSTWEAERELWEQGFVQRCGFIITPGAALCLFTLIWKGNHVACQTLQLASNAD